MRKRLGFLIDALVRGRRRSVDMASVAGSPVTHIDSFTHFSNFDYYSKVGFPW